MGIVSPILLGYPSIVFSATSSLLPSSTGMVDQGQAHFAKNGDSEIRHTSRHNSLDFIHKMVATPKH